MSVWKCMNNDVWILGIRSKAFSGEGGAVHSLVDSHSALSLPPFGGLLLFLLVRSGWDMGCIGPRHRYPTVLSSFSSLFVTLLNERYTQYNHDTVHAQECVPYEAHLRPPPTIFLTCNRYNFPRAPMQMRRDNGQRHNCKDLQQTMTIYTQCTYIYLNLPYKS